MIFCLVNLFERDVRAYYSIGKFQRAESPAGIKALPWLILFTVVLSLFPLVFSAGSLLFLLVLVIILGAVVPAMIGLLKMKKWGWRLTLIEAWLFVPISIFLPYSFGYYTRWLNLSVAPFLAIALYLYRRDVRQAFGIERKT